MNLENKKPVKISTYAKDKIIFDFFPEILKIDELKRPEKALEKSGLTNAEMDMHCGAFCLYSALITLKLFDNSQCNMMGFLQPDYKSREHSLIKLIKKNSKLIGFSDSEVKKFAHNLIINDVRNSFAHGNFGIRFDIKTGNFQFVLTPARKDIKTDKPIIIDSETVLESFRKILIVMKEVNPIKDLKEFLGYSYNDFVIRGTIIPEQLVYLANYYLNHKKSKKDAIKYINSFHYINYALLVAKIAYEQDEYYKIFGKDSDIFKTISLVRNSVMHENIILATEISKIAYFDGNRKLIDSVSATGVRLLALDYGKQLIKENEGKVSQDELKNAIDNFKQQYNQIFDGKHNFEEGLTFCFESYKDLFNDENELEKH